MSDGGKGSSPRPFSVSNEEYANRWDAIFAKDKCDHKVWTFHSEDYKHPEKYLYKCLKCGKVSTAPSA